MWFWIIVRVIVHLGLLFIYKNKDGDRQDDDRRFGHSEISETLMSKKVCRAKILSDTRTPAPFTIRALLHDFLAKHGI